MIARARERERERERGGLEARSRTVGRETLALRTEVAHMRVGEGLAVDPVQR